MKFIMSNEDKFTLELEADTKLGLKKYVIVTRKTNTNQTVGYDLYELMNTETSQSFSDETLSSFVDKYITEPLMQNQRISTISIYHEGNAIHEIGETIKVVMFEPNKPAYEKDIQNTRKMFSDIVGGHTEAVLLGKENLMLICNEEGMLMDLPQHRGFYGTFFVTRINNGEYASLTDEQIKEVKSLLDKKENFESKSKYLKQYFETHSIPRKVFTYNLDGQSYFIGSEIIIDFLLSRPTKEELQMIELEIRDIERNQRDIYTYLKTIGYQIAKRKSNENWS